MRALATLGAPSPQLPGHTSLMKLAAIVLSALAFTTAGVHAAPTPGFAPNVRPVNGSQSDPELSASDLERAFLEGVRSTGVTVESGRSSVPAIAFDIYMLYRADYGNMRVVSGTVGLRDAAKINGKSHPNVAVCDIGAQTWQAGPSSHIAVRNITNSMFNTGVKFAETCLRR